MSPAKFLLVVPPACAFWKKGTYCWEAWIEGEKAATKYFYVEDAGKNLGRIALKSRFDTCAGVSPANCSGEGPVIGATSEGIVILDLLGA